VVTYLLDTMVVPWAIREPQRLSRKAKQALVSDATLLLSVVSIWEFLVKSRRYSPPISEPAEWIGRHIRELSLTVLPLQQRHAVRVFDLPEHHRDPFDRMLICQAMEERLPIITSDSMIGKYAVDVIW
jgi:PIN domain nuclease of toxin-antitoxin system